MTTLPDGREPLLRYLTVQTKLDSELSAVLKVAAADTERRITRVRGVVEQSRLAVLLREIREIQQDLWVRGVGELVGRRLQDAREAASRAADALDDWLERVAGVRRAQMLTDAFRRQIDRGIAVDATRVPSELSARVYRNADLASKRIERIIRSAVIRGQSAKELAQQVRPMIDPSSPGGVSYAAMRLGRTELNNAFHQNQIAQAQRSWVSGVKWNLSRSHPEKDVCDLYAEHDEGLGRGVWDKQRVPPKPHPQCLCYVTYDLMSPGQALDLILAEAV